MVTPETGESERPADTSPRWKVPAALLTVVAGAAAVFALTSPDPAPSAATTTVTTVAVPTAPTTTVAFITQGEPLDFTVAELAGFPLAIMETEAGELMLVQGDVQSDGTIGVRNFVSREGRSWVPVGDPISPPNRVAGATVTDFGLVAYGQDGTGAPTIWITENGRSWNTHTIDPDSHWPVYQVGATHDLILATGFSSAWSELDAVVRERFGEFGKRQQPVWDGQKEPEVILYSPLGLPLTRMTVSDLGFDPARFEQTEDTETWATSDGINWYRASLPTPGYPGVFFQGNDGELWHARGEDFTTTLFSTSDALVWTERSDVGASGAQVQPWQDGLVSVSPDLRVRTSADGGEWSGSTVRDLFTAPNEWYLDPWVAGDQGLALVARWWDRSSQQSIEDRSVEVEHQGRVIRITPSLVTVLDSDRTTVLANVARWTEVTTPTLSFDEAAGTVTIHDRRDGDALVTFTLEELADLEMEAGAPGSAAVFPTHRRVLLTSIDGCNWTSQEIVLPGPSWEVYGVTVIGERVALSVVDAYETGSATQLWWATLPEEDPHDCPPE